jgi:hypothetical protein
VRAGSLRLSSRRLLSAALLAVRRRWQGECCDEADDGKGRYDGGGGAEYPQREAEGRRGRDPGGAQARRAHGCRARAPAQPRSTERGRAQPLQPAHTALSSWPRSLLPALRSSASSTTHTTPAARATHGRAEPHAWPCRAPRSTPCNPLEEDSTLRSTW